MKINCMDWFGDLPMLTNAIFAFIMIFSLEIRNKYVSEVAREHITDDFKEESLKKKTEILFKLMGKELIFVLLILLFFAY